MAATNAMNSSVAMLLARRVFAEKEREKKRPWVGAEHGSREGWGRGVATARSGGQLLCESRACRRRSCLFMRGEGQTRAVGSGSPRRAAVSVVCASVRWMRSTTRRALSRGRKSTPAATTRTTPSQRTEAPACRFSGIAMVRPTVRVTLCHARAGDDNSISANRRKHNAIRVHECRMSTRIFRAKVLLASPEPGESGWVVFADKVSKLKAQKARRTMLRRWA
eukprot:336003-Pleurochrysis_carterae.AAC.2